MEEKDIDKIVEDEQDVEIMREFELDPKLNEAEVIDNIVDEIIHTPTQVGISSMDFYEALEQIICGEKIHKLEWKDKNFYGTLENGVLALHKPDGKNYHWIISQADITGKDYIIVR